MSFLIEWAWLCLWNVQCKIQMYDFLPDICRNSSIDTIFMHNLSAQSSKPVWVLLLWTCYCSLWMWLSEGSLLCSVEAAEFQGISRVWLMATLQWPAQLSHFFSLLPSELVIKGKCLIPWAQSAYTTQLPRVLLYYQVSSTFLFCWLPSDWWHMNITSITLMPAETEDSKAHVCQRKKFLLSSSLIFSQDIYYVMHVILHSSFSLLILYITI